MTVSVVVPAYNAERYISRCIESVVKQTVLPLELILVDDGSVDGTLNILNEYMRRFPGLIRVIAKDNGGVSSARNEGIRHACGEYICFVDADDIIDEGYIESHLRVVVLFGADISFGQVVEFDDSHSWSSQLNSCLDGVDEGAICLRTDKFLGFDPVWGKLFRRSVVRDLQFMEGCVHEDHGYSVLALSRAARVVVCKAAIYRYYISSGCGESIMGRLGVDSFVDLLKVQAEVVSDLTRRNVSVRFFSIVIHGQLVAVNLYFNRLGGRGVSVVLKAAYSFLKVLRVSNVVPVFLGFLRFVVFKVK